MSNLSNFTEVLCMVRKILKCAVCLGLICWLTVGASGVAVYADTICNEEVDTPLVITPFDIGGSVKQPPL